jgi:hypothetical protein
MAKITQWPASGSEDTELGVFMAVATLNIAHYKQLLVTETDMAKRETIAGLLAKVEAGLAKLLKVRKSD